VEHGITELVNGGVDLVEWMLRLQVPGLEPLDLKEVTTERAGHSIEVRLKRAPRGRLWHPATRSGMRPEMQARQQHSY
jgi:acetyl/propionyl-CoA carboxylase alpha subunit